VIWLLALAVAVAAAWLIPYGFVVVPLTLALIWFGISFWHRRAIGGTDAEYAAHMAALIAKDKQEQEARAEQSRLREIARAEQAAAAPVETSEDPPADEETADGPTLAEWLIDRATGGDLDESSGSTEDDLHGKGGSFGGGGASGDW
jgi:uncharacterized membrane protein YgcG